MEGEGRGRRGERKIESPKDATVAVLNISESAELG